MAHRMPIAFRQIMTGAEFKTGAERWASRPPPHRARKVFW